MLQPSQHEQLSVACKLCSASSFPLRAPMTSPAGERFISCWAAKTVEAGQDPSQPRSLARRFRPRASHRCGGTGANPPRVVGSESARWTLGPPRSKRLSRPCRRGPATTSESAGSSG
jgi:hypothetical protein